MKKHVTALLLIGLAGCVEQHPIQSKNTALPELNHPSQAIIWMAKVSSPPPVQVEIERGNNRLLTLGLPDDITPVFDGSSNETNTVAAQDSFAHSSAQGKTGSRSSVEETSRLNELAFDDLMTSSTVLIQPAPVKQTQTLDLNQIGLNDFKYVGILNYDGEVQGYIKVGERLHKVREGQIIGAGQWRVKAIEPQKIQLLVDGRLMVYGRN
ncbi:pilus assembly protein PilP [Hydromonas duriensis]|uniref:Pilus assembly protein PilP n=1 Tax=Hydromonas duriensis TaxID=1527608 RepID=A0A4V3DK72_9BURK|nr:pilus assembly protein PilP [Hydromonas duriensis]TDR33010.1 pilus assembly protein PilP [Hydromonas duriensis]